MADEDTCVLLPVVKVMRVLDDSLVCVIEKLVRFIPVAHIHGATPKPGEVGSLSVPQWLAKDLGL
jgi:hypothetical protein